MSEKIKKNLPYILLPVIFLIIVSAALIGRSVYIHMEAKKAVSAWESQADGVANSIQGIIDAKEEAFDEYNLVKEEDIDRLYEEEYQAVFISMWDVSDWDFTRLETNTGNTIFCFNINPTSLGELESLITETLVANNSITSLYLYLDPIELIDDYNNRSQDYNYDYDYYELLENLLAGQDVDAGNTTVKIFYRPRYVDYWAILDEDELTTCLDEYDKWISLSNLSHYFLSSEEWLLINSNNYDSNSQLKANVAEELVVQTYCDNKHRITADSFEACESNLTDIVNQYCDSEYEFDSLESTKIIFLGDSIFAYAPQPEYSIPGVINALSGATVYNLASSGNFVTYYGDMSFVGVTEHLLNNTLPSEGEKHYSNFVKFYEEYSEDDDLWIVVDFGFNDYLAGKSIESDDTEDLLTFNNAYRQGIENLKARFPKAHILMVTPHYTGYFNGGLEGFVAGGSILTDYIKAEESIAESEGVLIYNTYENSGINEENFDYYLADLIHPTEAGDFLLGEKILEFIEENR